MIINPTAAAANTASHGELRAPNRSLRISGCGVLDMDDKARVADSISRPTSLTYKSAIPPITHNQALSAGDWVDT